MTKIFFLLTSFFMMSCAIATDSGPATVDYVDVNRYMGQWYEIAKYETSFQKKCLSSRANYSLKKGKVKVVNECVNKKTGKVDLAKGTAIIKDKKTNAKLRVSFVPLVQNFGWFAGDYWIIALDVDYQYVVVGHPSREYLWFLSRTPTIKPELFEELKGIARDQGYDLDKIKVTPTWNI